MVFFYKPNDNYHRQLNLSLVQIIGFILTVIMSIFLFITIYLVRTDYFFNEGYEQKYGRVFQTAKDYLSKSLKPEKTEAVINISMDSIEAESASVSWHTSNPTESTIEIGLNPEELDYVIRNDNPSTIHSQSLTDLEPNTRYYIRITTTTENQHNLPSDIYNFKTRARK